MRVNAGGFEKPKNSKYLMIPFHLVSPKTKYVKEIYHVGKGYLLNKYVCEVTKFC